MAIIILMCFVSGCTFLNKETYEISYTESENAENIFNELELYFKEIGFPLERKTHKIFPEHKWVTTYFLGKNEVHYLYTTFDYMVLTLDNDSDLFIEWIRISDYKEKPAPGYFDAFYQKVRDDLKERMGITVEFKLIEQGKS